MPRISRCIAEVAGQRWADETQRIWYLSRRRLEPLRASTLCIEPSAYSIALRAHLMGFAMLTLKPVQLVGILFHDRHSKTQGADPRQARTLADEPALYPWGGR